MCAATYQRSEPASGCICGPGTSSISSSGLDVACKAKKKSGPRPAHAVPSFKSLASKVDAIDSRKEGLADFANSISCFAFIFAGAEIQELAKKKSAKQQKARSTIKRLGPRTVR